MPVKRHFIGWDSPVAEKIPRVFLPQNICGPIDLSEYLVIVPTAQAGRRLRQAISLRSKELETEILHPPRVEEPIFFLRLTDESTAIANPTEVSAVWANVLMHADLSQLHGLFPTRTPTKDFSWAMQTAETIQQLRKTLVDGGYQIGDICEGFSEVLEEYDRWQDLAKLESAYLFKLNEIGLEDRFSLMIKRAASPKLPRDTKRVVIAAVPDPIPLVIQALEHLANRIPIDILVHAPESMVDRFDEWGRPIKEKWQHSIIEIPDPGANVILAASPASQSHKTLEVIASEQDSFGPADIAIGVPDGAITPFLAADLADHGLTTFDPSGIAVKEHPLYQLLESYRALINDRAYSSFSAFLRNADILDFLWNKYGLQPMAVLTELDRFQNQFLPSAWEDIAKYLSQNPESGEFPSLKETVDLVHTTIESFHHDDLSVAVRTFLQNIYDSRSINSLNPIDREFKDVANCINVALRELASETISALIPDKRHTIDLLLRRLSAQRYYPNREGAVIDLEGWLELPWNDAPLLIVTGMNEGSVPEGQLSDVFLPDSLRIQLNLRHDADRIARDAYLMTTLVESRHKTGRCCFITGKTSSAGDPLKPSRLLFRCNDNELPDRAERLFGDPLEKCVNHPATISFLLQATPPHDLPPNQMEFTKLSVTAFRDYLACPFRFYLKYILDMESIDDQKTEMDALDFGSLVHEVLQQMAGQEHLWRCEDAHKLSRLLQSMAERWVEQRFGTVPPLPVQIQLASAKQRLSAAARVQASLVSEGWDIIHYEKRVRAELNGMVVSGRIDRIDQHRETGQIRIIDYKTSDRSTAPESAHFASKTEGSPDFAKVMLNQKEKRWIDLQLPLYWTLLADEQDLNNPVSLGYFNLPKATNDTGVLIWEDFREEYIDSARLCAESIIERIHNRVFWPPTAKIPFDDFEHLFPTGIADSINIPVFEAFMKRAD